jgi:Zn-dependent protease
LGFISSARLLLLIPLVLSLTVHEYAHAWSARRLGDDTAERMGRLTLNPLVHLDILGTVILPILGVPFGWAKPVPVNPTRFRRGVRMGTGMAITAGAGPLANVVLAVLTTVAYGLVQRFAPESLEGESGVRALLLIAIQLNVNLAIFNLIPIPPLDGSRIVDGFLPYRFRPTWEAFTRLSPLLLLGVMFFGGRLIAGPANLFFGLLNQILTAITVPSA